METVPSGQEALFTRIRKAESLLLDAARGFLNDPSGSLESLYRLVIISSVWTWVNDFHEKGQNLYEEITFAAKHFTTEVARLGEEGVEIQEKLALLGNLVGHLAERTVRLACGQVAYEPRYRTTIDYYELVLDGMPVVFHEEVSGFQDDESSLEPHILPISA